MAETVVHYVGNIDPPLTDVIRLASGAPANLTGKTVKLKARREGGSALEIDRAATVTDAPNGAVTFTWLAGDVDTAMELNAWWEITTTVGGATQDTPEFVISLQEHAPVFRGLCELEDVTNYAPGYESDPTTDALLERLIVAESLRVARRTGREFRPITPAVAVRKFHVTAANARSRFVPIGDAATVSQVRILDRDQATVIGTVVSPDYVLWPETRPEWAPISGLYLPTYSASAVELVAGGIVEVTGTWGFPSVPEDIRQAVAALVIFRYMDDAAAAGTRFAEALQEVNLGAMFANARETVDGYMRPLVG